MTTADDEALVSAAFELKTKGANARVPNSKKLHDEMLYNWRLNLYVPEHERRRRFANLIHGAVLGLRGDWRGANLAFAENPFNWSPQELPPPDNSCKAYAALMATGQAVSLWHLGDENAGWAAMAAIRYFGEIRSQEYAPWLGVATLIQAVAQVQPSSVSMNWTLQLLNPVSQPATLALAQEIANGYRGTLRRITSTRPVTIPAVEGLYLFNEGA